MVCDVLEGRQGKPVRGRRVLRRENSASNRSELGQLHKQLATTNKERGQGAGEKQWKLNLLIKSIRYGD